jgi:hypothetical protein
MIPIAAVATIVREWDRRRPLIADHVSPIFTPHSINFYGAATGDVNKYMRKIERQIKLIDRNYHVTLSAGVLVVTYGVQSDPVFRLGGVNGPLEVKNIFGLLKTFDRNILGWVNSLSLNGISTIFNEINDGNTPPNGLDEEY